MGSPQETPCEVDVGKTAVKAGCRAVINVQPQDPFRPSRLHVSFSSTLGFTLDEVRVESTILLQGPVPAGEIYGVGRQLGSTTVVHPSRYLSITVTNVSDKDLVFQAVLTGFYVEWAPEKKR